MFNNITTSVYYGCTEAIGIEIKFSAEALSGKAAKARLGNIRPGGSYDVR